MLLKKKKIPKYAIDEIPSDSDRKNPYEENCYEENFDEKTFLMKKVNIIFL